jgi:carbonic anhydrase/acetyltransferase-like protein (isoleucine patch superfamily)
MKNRYKSVSDDAKSCYVTATGRSAKMTYDLTEDGPSGAHIRRAYIASFMDLVPEIDGTVFVAPTAAIVGAVRIEANSSVWHNVTIRGDNNYVTVGENTNIQDNSCIHIDSRTHPTIIGNDVTIGHCALVHACTIGDGGFVGMGAIVMDGAVIEPTGMLAAGAMLTPG